MIREWLASHGATGWAVTFLLGSLTIYLAVVVLVWLRPRSEEDMNHVAALPLAEDTGIESDSEGRKA